MRDPAPSNEPSLRSLQIYRVRLEFDGCYYLPAAARHCTLLAVSSDDARADAQRRWLRREINVSESRMRAFLGPLYGLPYLRNRNHIVVESVEVISLRKLGHVRFWRPDHRLRSVRDARSNDLFAPLKAVHCFHLQLLLGDGRAFGRLADLPFDPGLMIDSDVASIVAFLEGELRAGAARPLESGSEQRFTSILIRCAKRLSAVRFISDAALDVLESLPA